MRFKLPLCCFSAFALVPAHAADIKVFASPAFVNFAPMSGVMPLALVLKNLGQDARGVVHISSGAFQMDYPVELPRGSEKRLITYPKVSYADLISIDVSTNQGNIHGTYQPIASGEIGGESVLLVGDSQGDLTFLRTTSSDPSINRVSDSYVKPDDAPDRPVAYASLAAVVLGDGAERLPDAAVKALHTYVLCGGTLVFLGGASSPTLNDPRWSDLVPVHAGQPKSVSGSAMMNKLPGEPVGAFTIIESTAIPGSATRVENGEIIVARRDAGFGKALFFAFDPLDRPFTRWAGRRALFEKYVRPFEAGRTRAYLAQFSQEQQDYSSGYYGYTATAGVSTAGSPYSTVSSPERSADPFSTQLPAPTKVFWILAAYFVTVVPLNFLLLRKLKRGELAWVTAPCISVAFAGVFFAEASNLYSAKLSTATQGLLIANQGRNVFLGRSQLFFPRGGEFDLKMAGLDSIGAATPGEEYYYSRPNDENLMADIAPVDIGHIEVRHMSVSNLAFREIGFRQLCQDRDWVQAELADTADGATLKLTNRSSTKLVGASAIVAGQSFSVGELNPGATKKIKLPRKVVPDEQRTAGPNYQYQGVIPLSGLSEWSAQTKSVVIKATVDLPMGPQIGATVKARQMITLACFTGLHYGKVQL